MVLPRTADPRRPAFSRALPLRRRCSHVLRIPSILLSGIGHPGLLWLDFVDGRILFLEIVLFHSSHMECSLRRSLEAQGTTAQCPMGNLRTFKASSRQSRLETRSDHHFSSHWRESPTCSMVSPRTQNRSFHSGSVRFRWRAWACHQLHFRY